MGFLQNDWRRVCFDSDDVHFCDLSLQKFDLIFYSCRIEWLDDDLCFESDRIIFWLGGVVGWFLYDILGCKANMCQKYTHLSIKFHQYVVAYNIILSVKMTIPQKASTACKISRLRPYKRVTQWTFTCQSNNNSHTI